MGQEREQRSDSPLRRLSCHSSPVPKAAASQLCGVSMLGPLEAASYPFPSLSAAASPS